MGEPEGSRSELQGAEALFVQLLEREEALTEDSLDEVCRRHPEHGSTLRQLHARWVAAAGILVRAGDREFADEAQILGQLRGRLAEERYVLGEEVGVGGMGEVLSIRDVDLGRDLAMKRIRGGSAGPNVLARFLAEARITARLDHPGVVPVHDLGVDPTGRAYFTMKLVAGRHFGQVLEALRARDAEWPRARVLGALLRVCEALSFAHDRGILHRDVKPSNIMVGDYGEVYMMDWGLAKDLRASSASPSAPEGASGNDLPLGQTRSDEVLGTPPYMSPEQARLTDDEVGPPSDVYSIGVILYVILAGRRPYEAPDERVDSRELLTRMLAGPPEPVAELALVHPPELIAICERAMQAKPSDRYCSVVQLAEDLRAFLENRVVQTYRTGAWAEFRKWVRRNPGLAASMAVAVVVAIGGLVGMNVVQARANVDLAASRRAERQRADEASRARSESESLRLVAEQARSDAIEEREIAVRERDTSEIVGDFLGELLAEADPANARGRETTVREMVDIGRDRLVSDSELNPALRARLWQILGQSYLSLGEHGKAERLMREAAAFHESHAGPGAFETLISKNDLGFLYTILGRYDAAFALLDEALRGLVRVNGPQDPHTLTAIANLSDLERQRGNLRRADELARDAYEGRSESLGPDDDGTVSALSSLATIRRLMGELPEAEKLYRSALDARTRTLGADHPATLTTRNNLAGVLYDSGRKQDGTAEYESVVKLRLQVQGPEHNETLTAESNLAKCYIGTDRVDAGIEILERTTSALERLFGPLHRQVLVNKADLAVAYHDVGRVVESLAILEQVRVDAHDNLGDAHPSTIVVLNSLAAVYAQQGRHQEALELLEAALEQSDEVLGPQHATSLTLLRNMAETQRLRGRSIRACRLFEECVQRGIAGPGIGDPTTLDDLGNLAQLLERIGRTDEAEDRYREQIEAASEYLGPDDPRTLVWTTDLASLYFSTERSEEGETLLRDVVNRARLVVEQSDEPLRIALNQLAVVLQNSRRFEDALALYRECYALSRASSAPIIPTPCSCRET